MREVSLVGVNNLSSSADLKSLPAVSAVAEEVAAGTCVWFIGAGLSLDAGLPGVTDLTVTMLENAVVNDLGPWDKAARVALWEQTKRRLIHQDYAAFSGEDQLAYQSDQGGIRAEIGKLRAALQKWPVPPWAERLTNLGRVADLLHQQAGNDAQASVILARLMGFEPDSTGESPLWDKPPGFTQHLLALLVKEGRISTVITTNYDQLVEKACQEVEQPITVIANRAALHAATGDGPRCYKIHGCRGWYLTGQSDPAQLTAACEALVITERQLQNWRGADWARDLVTTNLRGPVLFIGFSASEPVLIATMNAVQQEVRAMSPGKIFMVSPTVSYGFYQYFALVEHHIDPTYPPNAIIARGREFLCTLYPMAIARYYRREAARAPITPPDKASRFFRCPDGPTVVPTGHQLAPALLSDWVEVEGFSLIEEHQPNPLPQSPLSVLLTSFLGDPPRYLTLDGRRDEFRELARLAGLMLAYNFPDLRRMGRLFWQPSDDISPTIQVHDHGHLVHVALIGRPEISAGSAAVRLATEISLFLQLRCNLGASGTYAFLCAYDIEEAEADRILDRLTLQVGPDYQLQLWTTLGLYLSKGGTAVV